MKNNGLHNSSENGSKMTAEEPAVSKGIPPHIIWPLSVIGLLVLGVGWTMSVMFASRSDGGVQVVENYYEKAIDWDNTQKLMQQSEALGWQVELSVQRASAAVPEGGLRVIFKDSAGQEIDGLTASVKATRPQTTRVIREMNLQSVVDMPGEYFQTFPEIQPGLWDFEISAHKDSLKFVRMVRKEL